MSRPRFITTFIGDFDSEEIATVNVSDISHAYIIIHKSKYYIELQLKSRPNSAIKYFVYRHIFNKDDALTYLIELESELNGDYD